MASAAGGPTDAARVPGRIVGWLLDDDDRQQLLAMVPAAYARLVAHHVTLCVDAPPDEPLPVERAGITLGVADDRAGVQALVIEIGGTTQRPDGSVFHVTWSLTDGRRAVESNDVIRRLGWTPLAERVCIRLQPQRLR